MRVLLACLLAACNQVYGLDATTTRDAFEPDRDEDGVSDMRDNCADLPNERQEDDDQDGVGNACDTCEFCLPCATGPSHDEDGDRITDGCDNCPGVENPDQMNDDGDDLGNACDPSNMVKHRRLLFDGFATLSNEWLPTGSPWIAKDDGVEPVPLSGGGGAYTIGHVSIRLPKSTTWFVEVGIETPPQESQGIFLDANPFMLRCEIARAAATFRLNNTGITDTTFFQLPAKARLRYAAAGPIGAQDPDCELVGVHTRPQNVVYNLPDPLPFALITQGAGRFTYVDVVGP